MKKSLTQIAVFLGTAFLIGLLLIGWLYLLTHCTALWHLLRLFPGNKIRFCIFACFLFLGVAASWKLFFWVVQCRQKNLSRHQDLHVSPSQRNKQNAISLCCSLACVFFAITELYVTLARSPQKKAEQISQQLIGQFASLYDAVLDDSPFPTMFAVDDFPFSIEDRKLEWELRKKYKVKEEFPYSLLGTIIHLQRDAFMIWPLPPKTLFAFESMKNADTGRAFQFVIVTSQNGFSQEGMFFLAVEDKSKSINLSRSFVNHRPLLDLLCLTPEGEISDPALEQQLCILLQDILK